MPSMRAPLGPERLGIVRSSLLTPVTKPLLAENGVRVVQPPNGLDPTGLPLRASDPESSADNRPERLSVVVLGSRPPTSKAVLYAKIPLPAAPLPAGSGEIHFEVA